MALHIKNGSSEIDDITVPREVTDKCGCVLPKHKVLLERSTNDKEIIYKKYAIIAKLEKKFKESPTPCLENVLKSVKKRRGFYSENTKFLDEKDESFMEDVIEFPYEDDILGSMEITIEPELDTYTRVPTGDMFTKINGAADDSRPRMIDLVNRLAYMQPKVRILDSRK